MQFLISEVPLQTWGFWGIERGEGKVCKSQVLNQRLSGSNIIEHEEISVVQEELQRLPVDSAHGWSLR